MYDGNLWDYWSKKKSYNKEKLELYYHIRDRNFHWLTSLSLSLLNANKNIRILKTDLWNEAKKDETFFIGRKEFKYGIDISHNICQITKSKHHHLPIVQGNIGELPFLNNSFDLIWDISTIDHYKSPETAILEYYNALTTGGILLLVVENPFCISYPIIKIQALFGCHVPFRTFLPSRILKICKKIGFEIVDSLRTNVHLPTFVVYPLEKRGVLEKMNRSRNFLWQFFKKYFVVLVRK